MTLVATLLSALVLPSFGSPLVPEHVCPHGWVDATEVGMGCLLDVFIAPFTWDQSNYFCQSINATLVAFENCAQLEFLKRLEEDLRVERGSNEFKRWTSGTDKGREGEWYWASTLDPVSDCGWANNQPDGGLQENCLALHQDGMELFDAHCDHLNHPMCQKFSK